MSRDDGPQRPGGRGRTNILRRGLVAVVAIALVGGACGGGDPADEASARPVGEPDETETTAEPSTTTTAPFGGWPVHTAPDGAYTVALPHSWELTTLAGDPAELATVLLGGQPGDPAAAEVVADWQQQGAHSVAAGGLWRHRGPEDLGFFLPDESLLVTLLPAGATIELAVDYYRQTPPYGVMVVDAVDEVAGGRGAITRIGVSTGTPYPPDGYIYLVQDGDRLWELRVTNWGLGRSQGLSDRTALSFTPSPVGA